MKINNSKSDLAQQNIEFEENKFLLFLQKFWKFSNFYGEYRAKIYLNSHQKNRNSHNTQTLISQ